MSPVPVNIPNSSMTCCGHSPFFTSSLLFRRLLLLLLLLALHGDLGGAFNRRHRHRRIESSRFSYPTGRIRALNSECYHRGRAQKCMPNFDNVVHNRPVIATSTCGSPPTRVCRTHEVGGHMKRKCHVCDKNDVKRSHPSSFLTDRHDQNNETCWISGPITKRSSSVNLTISFGKRFEILYIYLVPCGSIPDSITLYKSSDFGKTWKPWRYFSSNCYRAFGLSTSDERMYSYPSQNIQKAFCEQLKPLRAYTGQNAERIVFSTTTGQMSNSNPALIDWRTATDLRVVLSRFPVRSNTMGSKGDRRQSSRMRRLQFDEPGAVYYSFAQISVGGRCKCNGHSNRCVMRNNKLVCDCKHNTEGDDCERCKPFFYDRPWARATEVDANVCRPCDCNEHSKTCKFNKEMYKQTGYKTAGSCIYCEHNTMGTNCEVCRHGFYRNTKYHYTSPKTCKECTCNLHSNRCVFNKEVFLISGRTSGGVCQRCRHRTAGRACHYCQDGYYRDWTKPVSHERVCVVCNCHPLGSVNVRNCDKKTGQCQCKPGVTGQICDRCVEGYRQSSDPNQPCQSDTSPVPMPGQTMIGDIPVHPQMSRDVYRGGPMHEYMKEFDETKFKPKRKCKKCSMRKRRIRFKKFCRKHFAIQVSIISRTSYRNNVRFLIEIRSVYRRSTQASSVLPSRRINHPVPLWIPYENLRCKCPNLVVGKSYLIISNVRTFVFKDRRELLLYHRSIVLDWQNAWKRRMNKYKRRDRKGRCKKILRRRQNRGHKKVANNKRNKHLTNQRFRGYQYDYQRGQYLSNYQNNYDNYGYYGYNKRRA